MAKKMYYSEEETAQKLGVSVEALQNDFVREGKLRAFQDGANKMFKADEVDALTGGEEEIELAPAGDETADVVSIGEADEVKPTSKEDTVITAEGISIFDNEDLEIEEADPMAKTQIAPSLEDQIALDGVGSGSGLLDLTRESDDTSLGAEVLDHIDMEGAVGSDLVVDELPLDQPMIPQTADSAAVEPVVVEAIDAGAGLFGGLLVGCALFGLLIGVVALAGMFTRVPEFLESMKNNVAIVIVAGVAVCLVAGVAGLLVGKSVAARQQAMRRLGA